MHSTTIAVLSIFLAAFCLEAQALRQDVAARMQCSATDCKGHRLRWKQSQKGDDFKAYLQCLDECVAGWPTCASGFATSVISSIIPYVFPRDISRVIRCVIPWSLLIVWNEQPEASVRISVTTETEICLLCRSCIINRLTIFRSKLQRFIQQINMQSLLKYYSCSFVPTISEHTQESKN
ncbi:hypothetical protein M513_05543 [Trichuris suis]|uniref:Uncharacterized protein n=1 Tax=Trichuris suis TaxID=68888 RepID=A0A085M8T1_9BILA|nr:hypothetical protein M513_05543 [Trichuris suis]